MVTKQVLPATRELSKQMVRTSVYVLVFWQAGPIPTENKFILKAKIPTEYFWFVYQPL